MTYWRILVEKPRSLANSQYQVVGMSEAILDLPFPLSLQPNSVGQLNSLVNPQNPEK